MGESILRFKGNLVKKPVNFNRINGKSDMQKKKKKVLSFLSSNRTKRGDRSAKRGKSAKLSIINKKL
jgi:hypothetical protein